jgi:hypothetical protein
VYFSAKTEIERYLPVIMFGYVNNSFGIDKGTCKLKIMPQNFPGVGREEDPGIDDDPEHDPHDDDLARIRDRGGVVGPLDQRPPRLRKRKNARHPSRLSRSLLPKERRLKMSTMLLHIDQYYTVPYLRKA